MCRLLKLFREQSMLLSCVKKHKNGLVIACTIFLVLYGILMLRPIVGVADNGDFARIMNSTGLSCLSDEREERYFGYVTRLYRIDWIIPFGGGYISTQVPLVLLAVSINKTVSASGLFDIRFLGTIYIAILAIAAFLTAAHVRKHTGHLSFLSVLSFFFIFCDIGYVSYFNSLYGEPVSFVFLLLMAGTAMALVREERPAVWMLVLFGAAAFFFSGAKVQNSPAGLLAALLCLRLAGLRKDAAWKKIAISLAAAVVSISLICYVSVSKEIKVCNKYQSVFYGILRGSPDPAGDLGELGLDPSLAVLAGTNYFMESYPIDIRTPEFKRMIYEKVGYIKVAGFYLKHPERLLQKLGYAAENGFKLKQGFGNYEKAAGIRYGMTSNFPGFWSDFKITGLSHTLVFIAAFFLLSFLVLAYEYRKAEKGRMRFLIEFFSFIAIMGILQFILPVIADGEADISKHLFLFNISFDMLFAAGITYLPVKAAALVRHFRDRRFAEKLQTE